MWAILRILVNGDQASLLFFGGLAVLALGGTTLIDARRTREAAPGWGVFLLLYLLGLRLALDASPQ